MSTVGGAGRVRANRAEFDRLVAGAERSLRTGGPVRAAAAAELAASYAWFHHPGRFTEPRLERLLARTSNRALGPVRPAAPGGRVVHVATAVYPVGGHTALLRRWLSRGERGESPLVVLTAQHGELPADLAAAASEAGGEVRLLRGGDPIARAAGLAELLRDARLVVSHAHPSDVVPWLALYASAAPVVVMNHADHVFWLGAPRADAVAHFRASGERTSAGRRGIPLDRSVVVPLPIDPAPAADRDLARTELGVPNGAVVVLTMAGAHKYEPLAGVDLLDLVDPVLRTHRNALLLAVGPEPEGRWASHERVRAFGRRTDAATFRAAADVYVDSYPTGSLTSRLEAAIAGLPTIAYWPYGAGTELLTADDPGLDPATTYADLAGYRDELARLLGDADARVAAGRAARELVARTHDDATWREGIRRVYELAERRGHGSVAVPGEGGAIDELLAQLQAGDASPSLDGLVERVAHEYPAANAAAGRRVGRYRRIARAAPAAEPVARRMLLRW